jgi:plasmid stabilization system protein ParE
MLVGYLDEAEALLEEIFAQLYAANPSAASRFLRNLDRAYARLAKFPQSGHRIPEYPQHPCLEFIVSPYRFFYFIDERRKMVWIVDVWHGAQVPTQPRVPEVGVDI